MKICASVTGEAAVIWNTLIEKYGMGVSKTIGQLLRQSKGELVFGGQVANKPLHKPDKPEMKPFDPVAHDEKLVKEVETTKPAPAPQDAKPKTEVDRESDIRKANGWRGRMYYLASGEADPFLEETIP